MRDVVKPRVPQTHPCEECRKSFSRKGNLRGHQQIRTAEQIFPCGACRRRFTPWAHLATHQSIHPGQRPFCCEDCRCCSCLGTCLAALQRPHARAGPFGESLSSRISLSAHTRTHGEGSPSACAE
ncbi:oocyte zinc finger protein XlCOF26-like [Aphelocoma coerulescens]|uniref:oocyte zinc finger protein XlCOF26-like n=1 Tax=Aphelocoma coerulescens TaxID=39617 RepID=UPI003604E726